MDLATIIGLVAAFGLMISAIVIGGPLDAFVDLPSILLVLFGSVAIMGVGYPSGHLKNAVKVVMNAIRSTPRSPEQVLQLMREMSSRARREGVLVLEDMANDQEDPFLKKGIQMVVDGHDPSAIEEVLYNEVDKITERHKAGAGFYEDLGAFAPAMGMIGTLIGLVQMLQNLSDPSAIGPAMAVALLTTLYGAVIANVFALPIANKLKVRSGEEVAEKMLIVQGLLSILAGESPRFLVDRLNAQLPPAERLSEAG
jgi:chemotaxis protein MotA